MRSRDSRIAVTGRPTIVTCGPSFSFEGEGCRFTSMSTIRASTPYTAADWERNSITFWICEIVYQVATKPEMKTEWQAQDSNFEDRIRKNFGQQRVMGLIGAE